MAVVVDEFEVVPAPERPAGPQAPPAQAVPGAPAPASLREEMERTLHQRERRRARLEAS